MTLKTYDEVITYLQKNNRTPHLMVGNGFSMAYDSKIFSYNALHKFIEELDDELLSKLFEIVKTKNFEVVMQQLDNFAELIQVFGSDKELHKKVSEASDHLKRSLIDAIKKLHPEHVFKISDEESQQCAQFLSTYLNNGGSIFSTNYDILLYWVFMRNKIKNHIDGFGRDREDDADDPDREPEYSELRWGKYKSEQNVYYLHGALPIFDQGIDIIKEEYDGNYLLEKIEDRLNNSEYPVFVAAGNGHEKLNHIMHNRYLCHCYEALTNIEGSLITFGFNFREYDHHIIDAINKAAKKKKVNDKWRQLYSVYIGVYTDDDKRHIQSLIDAELFKCKVNIYDAQTAKIWR